MATPPGDPIPEEFRYWENLNRRRFRRLRRFMRVAFGSDPALPYEVVEKYARSYYDADPIAEAFVDEVYLTRGQTKGRELLEQAIEHGVGSIEDAPDSLKRLFAEVEQEPGWLDWKQVELGARVFRRFGTRLYSYAGAITLEGYRESSVAKPLAFTGAYAGESANRRFLETAAFWIAVSEPGGLRPGGEGIRTALRVRIMHVFVRRRLLEHPEWDLQAWGVPISQGDALLTLMGGSLVPGILLKLMGYRTSRAEIEAMLHFWRYVGHVMGVQPRWYPSTVDEALGLMFTSMVKGCQRSGDDGKHLAQSYVSSYAAPPDAPPLVRLRKQIRYALELGYVGFFVSKESRRAFELPSPGLLRFHPLAQFPFIFALETLRRRSASVDDWVDRRVRAQTKRWLRANLGERRAEYRAVESFTR